jgi:hypothetical protein
MRQHCCSRWLDSSAGFSSGMPCVPGGFCQVARNHHCEQGSPYRACHSGLAAFVWALRQHEVIIQLEASITRRLYRLASEIVFLRRLNKEVIDELRLKKTEDSRLR